MTYEWRLNIETNRWSYEEVADSKVEAVSCPHCGKSWTVQDLKDIPVTHSTDPGPWPAYRFTIPDDDPEAC